MRMFGLGRYCRKLLPVILVPHTIIFILNSTPIQNFPHYSRKSHALRPAVLKHRHTLGAILRKTQENFGVEMGDNKTPRNLFDGFINAAVSLIDSPVTWFRERVVTPNRESYPWYHQKLRRVPTIDECYTDDVICFYEANSQFKRDKTVDSEILNILRVRLEDCNVFHGPDAEAKCRPIYDTYKEAEANWFCKYGDLGFHGTVKDAYMKQKHRMVWERRHGPVGSGMKEAPSAAGDE